MEEMIARGWENLLSRFGGPMSFRVVVQPAVAVGLAIRAGVRDARAGRPPFLWAALTDAGQRRALVRHAWKDVGTVFLVAACLDCLYQVIVHASFYPLELLVTATALALVPYCLVRGSVTRVARRFKATRRDGARR